VSQADVGAFSALRVRSYRGWFIAQVFSGSGNLTQAVGLAWLVYRLTGRGVDLGLLSVATFGPLLGLGLFAGVLLDHVDRRRVLIGTQVAFISVASALGALTLSGEIRLSIVFALAATSGVIVAIDAPARQVYAVDMAGGANTASAIGLFEISINVSRVVGPAVAGILISTIGVGACFVFNAVTFLPPLLVLLSTRPDCCRPLSRLEAGLKHGVAQLRSERSLGAGLLIAVAGTFVFNTSVTLPVLATKAFGLGAAGYGTMVGCFGFGALPGAVAASRKLPGLLGPRVRTLCLAAGATVLATACAPAAPLAFVGVAAAGFFSIWMIALANTMMQLRTPNPLRCRVMALWTMALPGMNPVTGVLSGWAIQSAGARAGYGLGGAVLVGAGLLGWGALRD